MVEKQFGKNEVILKQGDYGDCFYQIVSGRVGVYTRFGEEDESKLNELGPDEYFGEMAVIDAYPRNATVVALDDEVKVLELSEDSLNRYFTEQPDKIVTLMKQLSSRLRSLTHEYDEVKAVLEEMKATKAEERSEGLLEKMLRFVRYYQNSHQNVFAKSVESQRETAGIKESGDHMNLEDYGKSTVIFREGEIGRCMYAIQSGLVGLYTDYGKHNEKKVAELTADRFFGEMGMLEDEPRSATAIAEEDDTCVEIIRSGDLAELFKKNPFEVDMLLRYLSGRLRKLDQDYTEACKAVYEASGADKKA